MKLLHIAYELHCEPWLIEANKHIVLSQILQDHITGSAHDVNGRAITFQPEQQKEQPPETVDGIRVIDISGVIGQRVSGLEKSSGVVDVLEIGKSLDAAIQDTEVAGILLRFDTPGGTVSGVPELAEKIRGITKPVVAWSDSMAASAGYWLASQADAIYGTPSSRWGSIGVYMSILDKSRAYEMAGIKVEMIKAGRLKGAGENGTSLSDEQRASIQANVDSIYGWFKESVSPRGVPDEAMQGQSYYGRNAIGMKLVDRLGTMEDALNEAKNMARKRMVTKGMM